MPQSSTFLSSVKILPVRYERLLSADCRRTRENELLNVDRMILRLKNLLLEHRDGILWVRLQMEHLLLSRLHCDLHGERVRQS